MGSRRRAHGILGNNRRRAASSVAVKELATMLALDCRRENLFAAIWTGPERGGLRREVLCPDKARWLASGFRFSRGYRAICFCRFLM